LYAMGRMQASMRGFAMRLKHMGFDAYVVFDTTTPVIGAGDLLIVNCAVTAVELNVIKLAKQAGARVCTIGAHPENGARPARRPGRPGPWTDLRDSSRSTVDPADGLAAGAGALPVRGHRRHAPDREARR